MNEIKSVLAQNNQKHHLKGRAKMTSAFYNMYEYLVSMDSYEYGRENTRQHCADTGICRHFKVFWEMQYCYFLRVCCVFDFLRHPSG